MLRLRAVGTSPGVARHRRILLVAMLCGALVSVDAAIASEPARSTKDRGELPTFTIANAGLVPGAVSSLTVATPEAEPIRSGRFVLKFSPPIFLDTPAVAFPGAPPDLTFGLTPLGAGRYAVEFAVPSHAADLGPGRLLVISGILLPSLRIGGRVHVMLDGVATSADGSEIQVHAQDARLPLISDPYPYLTVHVQDRYDLVPGSTVIVELQTYNPKLISDGQICLRLDRTAFTSVESIAVQGEPDVSFVAGPDDSGLLLVRFSSPTSSINRFEGAILRIGMRLAEDLPPGFETIVEVDVTQSFLRDHLGKIVQLRGDSGRFRIATSGF